MKLTIRVIICLLAIATSIDVYAQNYALSRAPAEPVITLDYQGDRMRRIDDAPTLSIFADGRVVMPQSYAHSLAYQDLLSQAELQELLDFIIRENRFFEYDPVAVNVKEQALPRQPLPLHLSETVIQINADNQSKEVRYHALGRNPMVAETRHLLAIRDRLDQVMSVAKLGGREEVTYWVNEANKEAGLKPGDVGFFTPRDLQSGGRRADGSVYVRFVSRDAAAYDSVTIDRDPSGTSQVMVARDNQ